MDTAYERKLHMSVNCTWLLQDCGHICASAVHCFYGNDGEVLDEDSLFEDTS